MMGNMLFARFLWLVLKDLTMKKRATAILIFIFLVSVISGAQSSTSGRSPAQGLQVPGYWLDPDTGLMWTGKDRGRGVSWKVAMKYCRNLRLAGYSDWRLATIDELKGIYDESANSPGLAGLGAGSPFTWHVKGNLFLTANEWSSERRTDKRGHSIGYEWYFNFNQGEANNQASGWPYPSNNVRALCVRVAGK